MSLKAKLEAVIYAAEEPVTLAQLAALFAADALEWKAEQEAAHAEQAAAEAGAADDPEAPLPLLNEAFSATEPSPDPNSDPNSDPNPEVGNEPVAETSSETDLAPVTESGEEPAAQTIEVDGPLEIPIAIPVLENVAASAETPDTETTLQTGDGGESDLKREARQRDREVRVILRQILDELVAECAADGRGTEIREIAGGYRMGTKPECHDAVRLFVKSLKPPLKLSLPALETLAVIAYKQPVTAPEVNEIRGVDSSGVFGSLLARKLIATAGRKQVIGRPILYKTTKEFLLRFGLKDVNELPSMEEFEKMAAIELEETEATGLEGDVTEIGEPEPVAPEESAEAIAADLKEELEEAGTDGESAAEPGQASAHATEQDTAQAATQSALTSAE